MTPAQLRASFLQAAIQGRLVPQDPADGNAADLLAAIRAERARLVKEKKLRTPKPLPPIAPDEIPFPIPSSWQWARIGDLFQIINGRAFKPDEWTAKGLPIVRIQNLKDPSAFYNHYDGKIEDCYLLNGNELLFSWSGTPGTSFGAFVWKGGKAILNQHIFKLLPYDTNVLDVEFAEKALQAELDLFVEKAHGGVGLRHITLSKFASCLFPLPPLAEQKRIVAKLEDCLALCEAYEERERLDLDFGVSMRKSLLQTAIQGKLVPQDPAEGNAADLLAAIRAERARLVKEKKLRAPKPLPPITPAEIPFPIPSSWQWVRLGEIARCDLGKTLNKSRDIGELKPYLCSINVYWEGIKLDVVKQTCFEPDELAKYRLQKGDLLICEGGEIGRSAIWDRDEEMYYQNALHRLRFFASVSPYYICRIIEFYKQTKRLSAAGKGVTIQHLVQREVQLLPIPLPPLAEQERIVAKLEELLPLCTPQG